MEKKQTNFTLPGEILPKNRNQNGMNLIHILDNQNFTKPAKKIDTVKNDIHRYIHTYTYSILLSLGN